VSGDLRSDLPHRSDGRAGRRSLIVGDGAVAVEFRSVSGDLRVRAVADDKAGRTGKARPTDIAPTDPPTPPTATTRPTTATEPDARPTDEPEDATEAARLAVLRALEAGEIDVAEAGARLAELEGDDA
jgi:hypothetical protein